MSSESFIPLPTEITQTNGGQPCDMAAGPCACGAWHEISDQEWQREYEIQNEEEGRATLADQVESAFPHLS